MATRNSKQNFLERNGEMLLEKLITVSNGKYNLFRIFSAEDLQKTTDNYNQQLMIYTDYYYTLYKGHYDDQQILVKIYSTDLSRSTVMWSINEVVIAANICHKNILRLIGCCLETEALIVVYEFPTKGIVSDYIFKSPTNCHQILSWEKKLKVASDTATALCYMHMSSSTSIIHRSMRFANMFLDENYVAKLCGFEFSVQIPSDKDHVEIYHNETIGFIAPETIATNKFTEKNDVFGFGAILMEIVTGMGLRNKKFSQRSWSTVLKLVMEAEVDEENLVVSREKAVEVIMEDNNLVRDYRDQVIATIELSLSCLRKNPDERPTAKEVVSELRRIQRSNSDVSV